MLVKVTDTKRRVIDDHISSYVQDRTIEAIVGCTSQNVYEDYLEFCSQNNFPVSITSNQFKARICRQHNLATFVTTVNGRSVRVIVEK